MKTVELELPFENAILLQTALHDYGAELRKRVEADPDCYWDRDANENQIGRIEWIARYLGHKIQESEACND